MTLQDLIRRTMLVGCVAVGIVSCGGPPSTFELCNETCSTEQRCGTLSDTDAASCHATCSSMKGAYSDQDTLDDNKCSNAGKVRSEEGSCLAQACNKVDGCAAQVDTTCVPKS